MANIEYKGERLLVQSTPSFFPRLDALAERLGVEPVIAVTGTVLLQGKRGYYDLFDLAFAFLDRLEAKSENTKSSQEEDEK